MSPRRQRLLFVLFSVAFVTAAVVITLRAFKENIVFFYSPNEIPAAAQAAGVRLRIGGLVKEGTVSHNQEGHSFIISDGKASILVEYKGMLPSLFREGQGVVAEGVLESGSRLVADRVLAKHDETYMPREVADSLKKSGHWRGGEGEKR